MPVNSRGSLRLDRAPGTRTLHEARIADMAAFEALPRSIRFLLGELAINLSCHSVLAYYRDIERQARALGGSAYDAEVWTLRKLGALEDQDITRFAALHTAAGVSVLRYGSPDRARRLLARRGYGRIPLPPDIQEAA